MRSIYIYIPISHLQNTISLVSYTPPWNWSSRVWKMFQFDMESCQLFNVIYNRTLAQIRIRIEFAALLLLLHGFAHNCNLP